jgi:hypothetical protein
VPRIKIHDGVIGSTGPLGLCVSCKHAYIRETRLNMLITCSRAPDGFKQVTSPVLRCRDYADTEQPTKWEFEQLAWTIKVDPKTNKAGFFPEDK